MKTLYIIHGWTYTIKPWEKTVAILKSHGIKVEFLLVPGLTSPSRKVWSIEDYVRWADKNLPERAVVLGHSNGGRILLNLVKAKPDRFRHLILLNSAGIFHPSKKRDLLRALSKIFAPLKRVPFLRRVVHKIIGAGDYSRAPENMKQTLAGLISSDRNFNPTGITTEASILWGEADTITPVVDAHTLHRALSNSTLTIVPRWTHAPYISHPAALAAEILKILERI